MLDDALTHPSLSRSDFSSALSSRYLAYALSTITSRSLPDVRDGLKPVHRRLLYAMRQLRLDPDQGFKKSARVVGDVMGKFHPHGDAAIYDAMVRLAQEFAMRYQLVDGQGNFGNIDGDNAAAMRYTEAKMTEISRLLLDGIDENAVDFRPTYDGESDEPVLLPAGFPNLLANGAQGIAVGMATSIPPHNIIELSDAALHLIKHPEENPAASPAANMDKILDYIKGPDFPTGGILVEPPDQIKQAYTTGKGGFRLRAKWQLETHGKSWHIVVHEIPYQVQKSRLIEKMAELLANRKLPMLADIRDESAEDIRIILEPKTKSLDPKILMESLFKTTDLETRIPLNLNVLDKHNRPTLMNLRQALLAWLAHRREVLLRRSFFRLGKIEKRLHILDGYLIVFAHLDQVISIIREAEHPRDELMRVFGLDETQATAILDMRLRALRRLEEQALRTEYDNLRAEQADLHALTQDESKQWAQITEQIKQMRTYFSKSDKRRTSIDAPPNIEFNSAEILVEKEPITVICSEKGWIRAMRGHVDLAGAFKYKEGDGFRFALHAETTDKLLLFADNGRFYTLSCDKLPRGRGFGEPLSLSIDIPVDSHLINLVQAGAGKLLLASSSGHGLIVDKQAVLAHTRTGKQALNLIPNAKAVACCSVMGDHIAVMGENNRLLIFSLYDAAGTPTIPEMGRGKGVILQRYRDGGLIHITSFNLATGLAYKISGDRTKTLADLADWQGKRASVGRASPKAFGRRFAGFA